MKKELLRKGKTKVYPLKQVTPIKKGINHRRYDLLHPAIIVVLGIIIYSNSFNCSFHFDDFPNIVNNADIRNLADIQAWWSFHPSRVIGIFSFALNYHFFQLDLPYWHLVNLLIHLINACLVWWLTRLIFAAPALKNSSIAKHSRYIALITALLFVSHPLATQSVTYIVQRLASQAAMFYLLSVSLYLKARLISKKGRIQYLLFAGAILSAILAIFTKENAYTLPFAIILVEFFFINTRKISWSYLKDYRIILLIAGLVGMVILVMFKFSFDIFKPIPPMLGHAYTVTPSNYLFTQFAVILKYIQLLCLPVKLMVDHDFPVSNNLFEVRTLISFIALIGILFLAIFLYKKQRILSFGIFWFLLTLTIESSIIPISDVIFEHRTYLPSFGFFLILSSVFFIFLYNRSRFATFAVFAIIIVVNSFLTFQRNKVWKDDLSLWNDNVEKAPNLQRPVNNRGTVYDKLGRFDEAIADYSKAISIDSNYVNAYYNRAVTYRSLNQLTKSLADYNKALAIDSTYIFAWSNRGITYANLGEWNKALADFNKLIDLEPKYPGAYFNRGIIYNALGKQKEAIADYTKAVKIDKSDYNSYYNRAMIYQKQGKLDNAIADYSAAVRVNPQFTDAWSGMGDLYMKQQNWSKAITDFSQAVLIEPENAISFFNRGVAYMNNKEWGKSIADYSVAIQINPAYLEAYANRGIVYASLMQWDKAIDDFTKAIAIKPDYSKAFFNRAVAYGNSKQWNKAIADYNKVLAIDPNFIAAKTNLALAYKNFNLGNGNQ